MTETPDRWLLLAAMLAVLWAGLHILEGVAGRTGVAMAAAAFCCLAAAWTITNNLS
ncbi:hypothetical protein ACQEVF_57990 [Nonomuraea polychroma]|uniref:hypothetical protein n=1 Tax=Nonomuraea polychroma TaxID=46176 RepID=UPI003D9074DE